ncbi:MAG: hypothetical protein KF753_04935 [Caldilineaceae bacterium]|nr:hypothetical protein [Caldilineaceae bacterium]
MNALATLSNTKTAIELSDVDRMLMEEAEQEEAAFDFIPPRLKIAPGGTNVFQTDEDDVLKTFTGIILLSQKARAYWPGKGSGQAPLCSSFDGSHGVFSTTPLDEQIADAMKARKVHPGVELTIHQDASWPDFFDCRSCPMAQWGSNHQGGNPRGQACKALRRLVVKLDDWDIPALLTLPPTSIKVWDAYATSLVKYRKQYFAVRTKVTLEGAKSASGDPYSIAAFQVAGDLTSDEKAAVLEVRRQYKSLIETLPMDADEYEYETDGEEELPVPF